MSDEDLMKRLEPIIRRRFSEFMKSVCMGVSCETWVSMMERHGISSGVSDGSKISVSHPVWGRMNVSREDALKILVLGELS